MYEFKLPDLGEGIHEGEVLKWHVAVGQAIKADDPLVDVETDKAAVTIPAPKAGKVVALNGKIGEVVHVGNVVAVIDDATGDAIAVTSRAGMSGGVKPSIHDAPTQVMPPIKRNQGLVVPVSGSSGVSGAVIAAPATRKLARELGVDIRQAVPTGPSGRVTPEDVKRLAAGSLTGGVAAAQPVGGGAELEMDSDAPRPIAPGASNIPYLDLEPLPDFSKFGPVEKVQLMSIRRKVARKMTTSNILAPHVVHMDEADVTDLDAIRKTERKRLEAESPKHPGAKLTLLAFTVKAVVAALKLVPAYNASVDPFREEIIYKKYYGIGIAVDSGNGLVVPVLRDADKKSVLDISADIASLADRARSGKLSAEDFKGGTFTITNMGPLGGTNLIPMINYPEVGILGVGRAAEKPVVRDGAVVVRTIMPLTLSFDHRIADGADAAKFVNTIVRMLTHPNRLLLEA